MPTFFLNIRDGDKLLEDHDGSVLPDVDAARMEAMNAAREMVANLVLAGSVIDGQCIEITDEDGTIQATVAIRDAIRFR